MIFERLKTILSEQFDIDESDITLETNIFEDLEGDSLDLIDIISSVEYEFDIKVEDDAISSISTVGDVVDYISEAKRV